MSGVFGWVAAGMAPELARAALERMRAAATGGEARTSLTPAGALGTWRSQVPVAMHEHDGLTIAVVGQLQWRTAELARIAAARGEGPTIADAYRQHGAQCLEH